jgi:hypothetical protein
MLDVMPFLNITNTQANYLVMFLTWAPIVSAVLTLTKDNPYDRQLYNRYKYMLRKIRSRGTVKRIVNKSIRYDIEASMDVIDYTIGKKRR